MIMTRDARYIEYTELRNRAWHHVGDSHNEFMSIAWMIAAVQCLDGGLKKAGLGGVPSIVPRIPAQPGLEVWVFFKVSSSHVGPSHPIDFVQRDAQGQIVGWQQPWACGTFHKIPWCEFACGSLPDSCPYLLT